MPRPRDPVKTLLCAALALIAYISAAPRAAAFSYIFADTQGVDTVTHPKGYTGIGGPLVITLGIDPASLFAESMIIPAQNAIFAWNELQPTVGNVLSIGGLGQYDFESILLHELGHALGLEHPNLGTESGVSAFNSEFSRSTKGANNQFDLGVGPDGVPGSRDDLRGDDPNLNWFHRLTNDPFSMPLVIDSTTYARELALLPAGDTSSVNGSRQVAAITSDVPANTEVVMQQGAFLNEAQRTLGHDDVAGIRYAMAGLDGIAGTADDYTFTLVFAGPTASADVVIGFDNSRTSFATTDYTAVRISPTHLSVNTAQISFNSTQPWHFNQTPVPEPSAGALLGIAALWLGARRRSSVRHRPARQAAAATVDCL